MIIIGDNQRKIIMLNFIYKTKVNDNKVSVRSNDNKFLGLGLLIICAFILFVVNKTTDIDLYVNLILISIFAIVIIPLMFGLSCYYVLHDNYVFCREGFKFKKIKLENLYYCCLGKKHLTFIDRNDKEISFNFGILEDHAKGIFITRLRKNHINYQVISSSGTGKEISLPYYDFIMKKTYSFSEGFNHLFSFAFMIFIAFILKEKYELGYFSIGMLISVLLCLYAIFNFINKSCRQVHVTNEGILVQNLTKKAFVSFNDISKAETIMVSYGGGKGSLSYEVECLILYSGDKPISLPIPISRDFTHFEILIGMLHNHGIPTNQDSSQVA